MIQSKMYRTATSLLAAGVLNFTLADLSRGQQQADAEVGQSTTPAAAAQSATEAKSAAESPRPAVAATPADPTGSWKWDFTAPDETKMDFTLKLKWDGKKLEGSYTSFDNTVKIEEAKLAKDDLSFVVRPEFDGFQMEVAFDGKVAKDEIRGTIGVDFGDQPQEFDWIAKRFVDVDDVVGTWELELEAPDGNVFESTVTVTKDEKGLHADYVSDFGEREANSVQIKDNQLVFEISSENEDFSFKSVYRGTPRGNVIEGRSDYDFGGNTGQMAFSGKRLPPKVEEKEQAAALPDANQQQRAGAGQGDDANSESATGEEKAKETTPSTTKPDDR